MPTKIVKCLLVPNPDGAMVYVAEDGRDTSELRFIFPDAAGELWYWTAPPLIES